MSRALRAAMASVVLAFASEHANAASNCKLIKIAEWQVRSQTGRLIVDGEINGQKIGVLLDTGAQSSFILRAAADRLGLTRQEARGYRAYGVGGETYVEYAVVDELKLGQAKRRNWRVFVMGERDLGRNYAFLLGYDFFEQIDVEFDLPSNVVRLLQAQDCNNVPLAYWATGGADEVKLETDNEHPAILVPVKLNGKPALAALDTGAGSSVVSRLMAAAAGVTRESPGSVPAGTTGGLGEARPDQSIGVFESFAIGGEIIRNPQIRFTSLEVGTANTGSRLAERRDLREMLLGVDFLRAHRVLVAHSQHKLYFTYVGGPVFGATRRAPPKPPVKPDVAAEKL